MTIEPVVEEGEEGAAQAIDTAPERTTISGHPIRPLYGPADAGSDPEREIGAPGSFPFTRGPYESMYRGRLWTMRQFAGFGTVEETNERFRYCSHTARRAYPPLSTCRP